MHRQRITRSDGRTVNIVQRRAHLSYCFNGCCCGRTDRGYAEAPAEVYKDEWLRRKMRNTVHLTKAGCLGPCVLANVASLVFDGTSIWFHSVNSPWVVRQIFEYIDAMLKADRYLPPPAELIEHVFNFYDWEARPAPAVSPSENVVQNTQGIALLTHADTDLLTLQTGRASFPDGLEVIGQGTDGDIRRAAAAGLSWRPSGSCFPRRSGAGSRRNLPLFNPPGRPRGPDGRGN